MLAFFASCQLGSEEQREKAIDKLGSVLECLANNHVDKGMLVEPVLTALLFRTGVADGKLSREIVERGILHKIRKIVFVGKLSSPERMELWERTEEVCHMIEDAAGGGGGGA